MTTWTAVSKQAGVTITDGYNLLNFQSSGYFSWEGSATSVGWEDTTDYTDAEHLIYIQSEGYQSPYVSGIEGISWVAVDKRDDTSWTQTVRSGMPEAQFELNEPLGGPNWEPVAKDT